jgi:hypothetical protein
VPLWTAGQYRLTCRIFDRRARRPSQSLAQQSVELAPPNPRAIACGNFGFQSCSKSLDRIPKLRRRRPPDSELAPKSEFDATCDSPAPSPSLRCSSVSGLSTQFCSRPFAAYPLSRFIHSRLVLSRRIQRGQAHITSLPHLKSPPPAGIRNGLQAVRGNCSGGAHSTVASDTSIQ